MKKYNTPEIVCLDLFVSDIIASSSEGEGNFLNFTSGTQVNIEDYFS